MIAMEHIHPILVHFPIVLAVLLAGFDLYAALQKNSVTGRTYTGNVTTVLVVIAALAGVAAAFFGDMALEHAESTGFSSETAEIHEALGSTTAAVLGVWGLARLFLWFRNIQLSGRANMLVSLISVGLVCLVVGTAYFGGELVYNLGVNVATVARASTGS